MQALNVCLLIKAFKMTCLFFDHPLCGDNVLTKRRFHMFKSKLMTIALAICLVSAPAWSTDSTGSAAPKSKHSETTGQYLNDTTVTTKVKSSLLADKDIKSFSISVTTVKGIVTLTGSVDNASQKKKAVKIASKVKGVKSVKDKLMIGVKK